jgi:hypothetical protein
VPRLGGHHVHVYLGELAMLRAVGIGFGLLALANAACLRDGSYEGGGRYETLPGEPGPELVPEDSGVERIHDGSVDVEGDSEAGKDATADL